MVWHRTNKTCKRLDAIPGDPKVLRSGRDFSAWVGLVLKQNSSGGGCQQRLHANDIQHARQILVEHGGAILVVTFGSVLHKKWGRAHAHLQGDGMLDSLAAGNDACRRKPCMPCYPSTGSKLLRQGQGDRMCVKATELNVGVVEGDRLRQDQTDLHDPGILPAAIAGADRVRAGHYQVVSGVPRS